MVLAQPQAQRVSVATVVMAVLGWMGSQALPARMALLLDGTAAMVALVPMVEMAATQVLAVSVGL